MKIAFVTFEYPKFIIGGAGVYAEFITQELSKLGHEVTVFTPNIIETVDKKTQNLNIIRVDVNKKLPFKSLQFWLKLPKVLKDQHLSKKFDLVHINGISYCFLKKRLLDIPQVITIHHPINNAIISSKQSTLSRIINVSGETSFLLPHIEKRAVISVDKLIAVSEFTKKQIIEYYKLDPNKISVIYNGIDKNTENFKINPKKFKMKNNLPNKKMILFVGRINDHRKGLDILINAFKMVLDQMDAILVVVGNGDKRKFLKISKMLGISSNIFFIGFIDDITLNKYYQSCDVYVCPSRMEGFGLTILEAVSNGAPVVASNVGAIPEIIKNGENGFLVDVNDPKQFAKAICSILNNKSLKNRLKLNNMDYKPQSWTNSAKGNQNLYYSLIGEKKLE